MFTLCYEMCDQQCLSLNWQLRQTLDKALWVGEEQCRVLKEAIDLIVGATGETAGLMNGRGGVLEGLGIV